MDREAMRTWIFRVIGGAVIATVGFVIIGSLVEVFNPQFLSDRVWGIVSWGWGAVIGEFVVLFITLAKNVFGLQSVDLATKMANMWAVHIVETAKGNPADLKTAYKDTIQFFEVEFGDQGGKWLETIKKKFKAETWKTAMRVSGLEKWKPPEGDEQD
jgi:hypothetical protein